MMKSAHDEIEKKFVSGVPTKRSRRKKKTKPGRRTPPVRPQLLLTQ